MKKILFLLIALLFTFYVNAQKSIDFVKNQLIIKFKKTLNKPSKQCIENNKFFITNLDFLNTKNKLTKINLTGNIKEEITYLITFDNIINIQQKVNEYQNTNLFEYVEPNYIGSSHGEKFEIFGPNTNDDFFYRQWPLVNDGSFSAETQSATVDADIDMELAWDIETGSPDVIVAVLDSGVKINHPEFEGRIWTNNNENNDDTDTDTNGYIDDINGWNFESNNNNLVDAQGHGSNVAGIIASNANNNIGYAGVDWNCKIMVCRVLDNNGDGLYSWWTEAIYYAVNNGANIINMSLGGNGFSQTLKDAIDYAYNNNVTVIVSSGNQNVNGIQYPARYENAIAVGATDADDQRSSPFFWSVTSGSNFGENLDIIAPGGVVYGILNTSDTNYEFYWGGTSQAAPHVTGVASLLLAQEPTLTPDQIRETIETTADDQVGLSSEDTPGFDIYHGHGRLNAYQALLVRAPPPIEPISDLLGAYPNPISNGIFEITNLNSGDYLLSIVNTIGVTVLVKVINETNSSVNIEHLTTGTYFVKVNNFIENHILKIVKI